ncbi:hypothetical protein D3C73_1159880 [compost metagenome]
MLRIFTFYKERFPAHACEVSGELFARFAGKDCRVADLEAVQMQDRQYRPVSNRVDETVGEPGSSQRSSLSFAVADNYSRDQVRIIQNCANAMG